MLFKAKETESLRFFGKEIAYVFLTDAEIYIISKSGSPQKFRKSFCEPFYKKVKDSVFFSGIMEKAELSTLLTHKNNSWRNFAREHLQVFEGEI